MTTSERIEQKLGVLHPESIDILDESGQHIGHEGAKGGGGHYQLVIVSPVFAGKSALERHRVIYEALGDMLNRDIHALSIKAYTADEI